MRLLLPGWLAMLAVLLVAVFTGASARAQEDAPTGLLLGDLLAWKGSAGAGEVIFRNAGNRVYQCSFDGKTYVERSNARSTVSRIEPGDHIEVLADRRDESGLCYARTIHVIETRAMQPTPGLRARTRPVTYDSTELFTPRGDLTFAGVVRRLNAKQLTVRTRNNERKTIQLRSDTRFLSDGLSLTAQNLRLNTRVFIRAGRNLDNDIEAYQVIWRELPEP